MTPKQWDNVAKFFFDLGKLTFAIVVLTPLATKGISGMKTIAFGIIGVVTFFMGGLSFGKKGEQDD